MCAGGGGGGTPALPGLTPTPPPPPPPPPRIAGMEWARNRGDCGDPMNRDAVRSIAIPRIAPGDMSKLPAGDTPLDGGSAMGGAGDPALAPTARGLPPGLRPLTMVAVGDSSAASAGSSSDALLDACGRAWGGGGPGGGGGGGALPPAMTALACSNSEPLDEVAARTRRATGDAPAAPTLRAGDAGGAAPPSDTPGATVSGTPVRPAAAPAAPPDEVAGAAAVAVAVAEATPLSACRGLLGDRERRGDTLEMLVGAYPSAPYSRDPNVFGSFTSACFFGLREAFAARTRRARARAFACAERTASSRARAPAIADRKPNGPVVSRTPAVGAGRVRARMASGSVVTRRLGLDDVTGVRALGVPPGLAACGVGRRNAST